MSFEGRPSPQEPAFVATNRQVACSVGNETVILQLDEGVYYSLNAVGAHIWTLLKEPRTTQQLVERVLADFEVDAPRCRADVEALLADLSERGLITVAAGLP